MENDKDFKPLPGIDEYLEITGEGVPVSCPDLEDIKLAIKQETGLSDHAINSILTLFFQEIRSAMLQGKIVDLNKLGRWFISSPKVSGNKRYIFPKFEAKKSLLKRMSDRN